MLHTRNVLVAAAAEGARHGANADRTPEQGVERTRQVVAEALSAERAAALEVRSSAPLTPKGSRRLEIEVSSPLPVVFLPVGPLRLTVRGHALRGGAVTRWLRRDDDGNALVEFTVLSLLLLVPLVYVLLGVFQVQRAAFGVTEAARQAGRAFAARTPWTRARPGRRRRPGWRWPTRASTTRRRPCSSARRGRAWRPAARSG